MRTSELRSARDYNRGLAAPIRYAHVFYALLSSLLAPVLGPIAAWATTPSRRTWAPPLLIGALLVVLLFPFDAALSRALRSIPLRGDFRRELEAAQQYGQGVSTALIALIIYLQDPKRRRNLLDWGAALATTGVAVILAKTLIGRPRPKFDDPAIILGPLGQYPVSPKVGVRHAWEFWSGISADLWSMPSSHTAYVVVMAIFISSIYPRLKPLAWIIAATVALARVWTGAHYPTDIIAGAVIALAAANTALARHWGQRLFPKVAAAPASRL